MRDLRELLGVTQDEYLDYDPEEILYNGQVFTGCKIDRTVIYPQETRQRVQDIVMEQRRRYAYLFK
ncbi:MAG: hypothetical protein II888_04005 [Clostridia bacterium]|nr:hypothetical protein [Clostridia bacterium]